MIIRNRSVTGGGDPQARHGNALDRPEIDETTFVNEIERLGWRGETGCKRKAKGPGAQGFEFFEVDVGLIGHSFSSPQFYSKIVTLSLRLCYTLHMEALRMREQDEEIHALRQYLTDEIIIAFGLKKTIVTRRAFDFFFNRITTRLSTICVLTDRKISSEGFPAATGWMAGHWIRETRTRGAESVPAKGPLLVVSNHVGAYDILVVPSQISRRDIKIIASDTPFFKSLPNASQHMIYASEEPGNRMAAARHGITCIKEGGALLLFGTGLIDPDPAIYPQAESEIGNWSRSIDLFLRQVPQAQVVICILSGIVLPRWAHSPLTWLRRIHWQKRRIAEYGQVIEQLLFPGKPNISPSMTIAPPVGVEELRCESGSDQLLPAVISRGRMLLADHIAWIQAESRN